MTGQKELKTQELFDSHRSAIEKYIDSLGLNRVSGFVSEVESALQLTQKQIRSLTPEECGEYAYTLSQYALYIQEECNHHTSRLTWAEHNLSVCIGNLAKDYGEQYSKYEERKAMVIKNNEYAGALSAMMLEAKTRVKELDFLANKISAMSKIMVDLQYNKRANRYDK